MSTEETRSTGSDQVASPPLRALESVAYVLTTGLLFENIKTNRVARWSAATLALVGSIGSAMIIAQLVTRPKPPVPVAADAPASTPAVDPRALAATPRFTVQVGAFRSEKDAYHQLDKIEAMLPDRVKGTRKKVTAISINGTTHFRARFLHLPSREEARDLCSALKTEGEGCFIPRDDGTP